MTADSSAGFELVRDSREERLEGFGDAVREGLCASPKRLPCRVLHDEVGSLLFEEICGTANYYPFRAKDEILSCRAETIIARMPEAAMLVELGSGSAAKTEHLITAALAARGALRYVPIDISFPALEASGRSLANRFEGLDVLALCPEYESGLTWLESRATEPKLVLWLGSNIGNLERADASVFLGKVHAALADGDSLLVGIDLRRDASTLEAAYADSEGVTARFVLNLLARANRELGARFDLDSFRHVARYDAVAGMVELWIESRAAQRVAIEALGLEVSFEKGERVHVEDSYKHSLAEIDALAKGTGLGVVERWFDSRGLFSLNLCRPQAR